jgi:hypothetical protein
MAEDFELEFSQLLNGLQALKLEAIATVNNNFHAHLGVDIDSDLEDDQEQQLGNDTARTSEQVYINIAAHTTTKLLHLNSIQISRWRSKQHPQQCPNAGRLLEPCQHMHVCTCPSLPTRM